MEKTWQDIVTITPQENATFDIAHSDQIATYINTQCHRVAPYERVDLNRLNNNFFDRETDTEEVIRHIKRMKK